MKQIKTTNENSEINVLRIALSRIFGTYRSKSVSPKNHLNNGYFYNIQEKVSPNNLLNTAVVVNEQKKSKKKDAS